MTVEDLFVDRLIRLNVGAEDADAAANDGLSGSCGIVGEPQPGLEQQVIVIRRRLDLQAQLWIEDAEIVVVADAEIEGEPLRRLPIVLHPTTHRVGGNVDIEVAKALHISGRQRAERRNVPSGDVIPDGKDGTEV